MKYFSLIAMFVTAAAPMWGAWADDGSPNHVVSTVPVDPVSASAPNGPTLLTQAPSYFSISSGAGTSAASNTQGGTSNGIVVDLFSFRKMEIGSMDDHCVNTGLVNTDNSPVLDCNHAYPTHALEVDANLLTGRASDGNAYGGGSVRVRAMIAGTTLGEKATGFGFYIGGGLQADGSVYDNRAGVNQLIANIGPEAGLIYRSGDVMVQIAPTVTIGNTLIGTDDALQKEIDTGLNMLGLGGKARMLIGDRLYLSVDSMWNPALSSLDWSSWSGSLSAQIRAGQWVFAGTVKRIEMTDPSGIYQEVKGDEATATAGFNW